MNGFSLPNVRKHSTSASSEDFKDDPSSRTPTSSLHSSTTESRPKQKSQPNKTVVLVTGCSTGIGKELILQLIKDPKLVIFATMRNKMSAKGKSLMRECEDAEAMLNILELDVSKPASIDTAIKRIMTLVGRVDVLVNNAGYGLVGPVEGQSLEEVKAMFDVNFFGALSLIQKVAPGMREQRSGRVINITGVHGVSGRPFEACYSASKFALEGLTNSMAPLYKKFGVHFCTVAPGDVKTEFGRNTRQPALSVNKKTGHMDWSNVPHDLVEPFGTYLCSSLLARKQASQSALEVTKVIIKAIKAPEPLLRYETSKSESILAAFELSRGSDRNGKKLLAYAAERHLGEAARKPATPVKSAKESVMKRLKSFRRTSIFS